MADTNNNKMTTEDEVDYIKGVESQKEADIAGVQEDLSATKSAYDILYNQYQKNLQQQKATLGETYEQAKAETYAASKVSAQAENEALAAQGLAGTAYSAPTSGYSESSRLKTDIALQNNLQALSKEQRTAVQELASLMSQAEAERMSTFAGYEQTAQQNIRSIESTANQNILNYQLEQQAAQNEAELNAYTQKLSAGLELSSNKDNNEVARYNELNKINNIADTYAYQLQLMGAQSGDMYAYNKYNLLKGDISQSVRNFIENFDTTKSLTNPTTSDNGVALTKALDTTSQNFTSMTTDEIDQILNVYGISGEQFLSNINALGSETINKIGTTKLEELYDHYGVPTDTVQYKESISLATGKYDIKDSSDFGTKSVTLSKGTKDFMSYISSWGISDFTDSKTKESIISNIALLALGSGSTYKITNTDDVSALCDLYGITFNEFETIQDNIVDSLTEIASNKDGGSITIGGTTYDYTQTQAQALINGMASSGSQKVIGEWSISLGKEVNYQVSTYNDLPQSKDLVNGATYTITDTGDTYKYENNKLSKISNSNIDNSKVTTFEIRTNDTAFNVLDNEQNYIITFDGDEYEVESSLTSYSNDERNAGLNGGWTKVASYGDNKDLYYDKSKNKLVYVNKTDTKTYVHILQATAVKTKNDYKNLLNAVKEKIGG